MGDQPRFTLTLTLRDSHGFQQPISMAVGIDRQVRISLRAMDELKAGVAAMDQAVQMMRTKSTRKDLFLHAAANLGALLAERMGDAEGWHDESRVEPARQQLGGKWEFC